MELIVGYKQTEVGAIPNEWEVAKLASVGEVIRGASPRPKGDKRFYGGSIPRLMVEDVTRDGKVVIPQVDFLTVEGARRSRPCKKGTLTIVCSGTVGITSFLGVDACIHDGFLALIGIRDSVNDDYLYHQLCRLRESFDSSATHGGVFTNLTTAGVREFVVPLPPTLAEQEAIAEALSDADALIESLEQLIAKKHQIKQGAMQELLTGKRRLEGFSGEWETKKLGELAVLSRINVNPATFPDCLYSHFSLPAFDAGAVPVIEEGRQIGSNKFSVPENAVLMSKLNPRIPRVWLPKKIPNNSVCSTEFLVLVPSVGMDRRFLGFLCASETVQKYMELHAIGTTGSHQRIHPSIALGAEVMIPRDEDEQSAIVAILSDVGEEMSLIETKLVKARQIKQGMMQELLTGRIRLV